MSDVKIHSGACFCGAVQLKVTGAPALMGYCHCQSCRKWSAGPVNAFTLWNPQAVQITEGAEHLRTFNLTAKSFRKWCAKCGGHVLTDHPGIGLVDVYAAVLPELAFKPALHVNYSEAVLRLHDGLLKLKESSETRACAAIALGKIRTAEAREILTQVADDKDLVVRNAVNRALRESAK